MAVRGSGLKFLRLWHLWCRFWLFAAFGVMGDITSAPARLTGTTPYPHRSLPVAPLIGNQRCYGEATVWFPGGYGAGLDAWGNLLHGNVCG